MIDRKVIIGMILAIAIISAIFMLNISKSNPATSEKKVGYDLINNDNSVVSAITSSYIKDGNLIIHISNPNNEKIQIIGLEGKKYKIKPGKVIIYDYKGEQFKLKIGSHSDVYEVGNWIIEGDKVYVDNSSWGRLEAYPHTIYCSGWVYFNVTMYKDFGDLDFLWGFNTTEVKPVKAEFYKPHFVNWTTNHSMFFYNVSSISTTNESCDYGNEYNSYKRNITYQVCLQWNETTWECEKYNITSAVVCFDSYEQNGTNYTIFWHTNHSRLENWLNVGKYLNHTEYNYDGMDKWWYIKNFEIEPNKTYTARTYVKVPVTTEGTSGKYYFAVKRSAETLSEAISSGHFMVLDPWWNASWSRKRAIHINNTGNSNALTDYQVMINITYDSDMQSDFDDIRVVNETSGETVPYWNESAVQGSWNKIWFNASYIPASSWCNDTYYLYYGNPDASSASDVSSTFIREINGNQPVNGSWHFDENSGTTAYDTSGKGNDGTLTNGPQWTTGKFGSALSFDGENDYVDTNLDVQPSAMAETTWEAWIYPKSSSDTQAPLCADDGGYDRCIESTRFGDGYFNIFTGSAPTWTPTQPTLNQWQHIVVIWTTDNIYFYKNGVKYTYGSAPSGQASNLSFNIGRNPGFGEYFNGLIDEVRIYNRALSAEEISDLYNYYGYTTTNYPGRVLVRKRVDPEPTAELGSEERTYNVSGYIKTSSGTAIENAYVTNNVTSATDYTNSSGYYNLSLPNGTFLIKAEKLGYASNTTTVTVSGADVSNVNITLENADTTFTVTLPAGYTYAHFNLTGVENPSTQTNYPPEGQSDTQPFYNVTNTGNVNLSIRMQINATIPNVILKVNTDNNPSEAKEVNTTLVEIYSDLPPDNSVNIWLWTDLSHAEEQETGKNLTINVTQVL